MSDAVCVGLYDVVLHDQAAVLFNLEVSCRRCMFNMLKLTLLTDGCLASGDVELGSLSRQSSKFMLDIILREVVH